MKKDDLQPCDWFFKIALFYIVAVKEDSEKMEWILKAVALAINIEEVEEKIRELV